MNSIKNLISFLTLVKAQGDAYQHPRIENGNVLFVYDTQVQPHDYFNETEGIVPTFMGYFNVTVDNPDDPDWDDHLITRLCI